MSYIVFARKYRPQTFDEIIGQPHITTTLKNAISQNRVAHAYIFAGPRGVGKTTTARILAKALNCEKGPRPAPCNSCISCNEITQGSSLDILEIDGASNRGIEEIRNLRENVKFAPSKGKFKIYIIDEVHMLTPEAFNALLRTLEEPPPHVKFVFATTQGHKVPPTILSRCQRFDFRRISTKDIFGNLKDIAKKENLEVKDEVLILIAKHADGSMRDGQVILDQMISFTQGKRIELEDIVKILGLVDEEVLFSLSKAIKDKDAVSALKIIDRLINEGKDATQVVLSLIEHFRNISVIKISSDLDSMLDLGPDKIRRYEDEAPKFTIEEVLYVIYTLSNTLDFIRKSNLARVPLETAMVKLARAGSILSLGEIIDRINKLGDPLRIPRPREEKPEVKTPTKMTTEEPSTTAVNKPEMDEILNSWNSVINYIKPNKISIASYLQEGYPVNLEANTLSIGFPEELKFHKEVLDSPDNRLLIEEAIKETLKLNLKVAFIMVEPLKIKKQIAKENSDREEEAQEAMPTEDSAKKDVDPIIKLALDTFGGTIMKEGRERLK